MAANTQRNEGQISTPTGGCLANYIRIFSTNCLVCHDLVSGDGEAIVLGDPYNGVLHVHCYPKFSFPGRWVHSCPEICYKPGHPAIQ